MILDGLNSAYNSIEIGNGSVYDFVQYIEGINLTGGILRHTINRGFLLNNLSYNFNGGMEGSYGYGTDSEPDAMRETYGLVQDAVGDLYTTNYYPQNPMMRSIGIKEFSALGDEIRREMLSKNGDDGIFKNRYASDGNDAKFIPSGITPQYLIGDESVSVWNTANYNSLFGKRKPLKDSDEQRSYRFLNNTATETILDRQELAYDEEHVANYQERSVETPVHKGNITELSLPTEFKSLDKHAKERRDKIQEWLNIKDVRGFSNAFVASMANSYPEAYRSGNKPLVSAPLLSEYIVPTSIKIPNFNQGGLYAREEDTRWWIIDEVKNKLFGAYEESKGPELKQYIIKEGFTPDRTLNPSFNPVSGLTGAKMRTNNPLTHNATYSYYQEGGVSAFKKSSDVSDGSSVEISTFGGKSRLLQRTNELFKKNEIKTLINRFHTANDEAKNGDFLISSYYSGIGLSRGRNLKKSGSSDKSTGYDNPYCRVWTAHHQYSKMSDRIRPFYDENNAITIKELQSGLGGLRPNDGAQRLNDYSVLQNNGFVKISPHHNEGKLEGGTEGLKKYMFSIENLAWKGFATSDRLSPEQRGPFGGRIMWFPPYNLKFNENINTSWKDNDFIGRGEKIYTYVNTDRNGTLNFTLLIDHPSVIDKWHGMGDKKNKYEDEEKILRFFAGCETLDVDDPGQDQQGAKGGADDGNDDNNTKYNPNQQYIEVRFIVFFPNNFSASKYHNDIAKAVDLLGNYEVNTGVDPFREMDPSWEGQHLSPENYDNISKFKLNKEWGQDVIDKIEKLLGIEVQGYTENFSGATIETKPLLPYTLFQKLPLFYNASGTNGETTIFGLPLSQYEVEAIITDGFASDHGYESANMTLAKNRANTIKLLAKYFCNAIDENKFREGQYKIVDVTRKGQKKDVNDLDAKIARSAVITFRLKLRDDVKPPTAASDMEAGSTAGNISNDEAKQEGKDTQEVVMTATIVDDGTEYNAQNEYMYFSMIEHENPLVYKNLVNKIKFFDPAFHSITPEGFNARLNFLQQCTRQGPTIGSHNGGQNPDGSRMSELARNLSFGMAPYCILRIGDFFYSKICIDSISIDYDTGSGIQWDLNPEGIGVQPMMANVNMSFHFIGGQDIEGPVEQLQNAISYNYYANSSIYTPNTQRPMPMRGDVESEVNNKENEQ